MGDYSGGAAGELLGGLAEFYEAFKAAAERYLDRGLPQNERDVARAQACRGTSQARPAEILDSLGPEGHCDVAREAETLM